MSRYEKRLEEDWAKIRQHLSKVSAQVENSVEQAVDALLLRNEKLAYSTILGDNPINRAFESINQLCYGFVARHLPSAGHLRRISSILRFNLELERVGDYAVTVCREIVQISCPLEDNMIRNVEHLSKGVRQILKQSIKAFQEDNLELAKSTMDLTALTKINFERIFNELSDARFGDIWTLRDLFGVLAIYNALGRISDQSKNICEETIFTITGETKIRKPVKVLFLDQGNDCQSLIAECFAQKNFPLRGQFASAGRSAAKQLEPQFVEFMNRHGFGLQTWNPIAFNQIPQADGFDVVVSLQGSIHSYLQKAPFRTILQEWEIGEVAEEMGSDQKEASYENMLQKISFHVQDLMETMRGKEVS
ncbi:MAG: hypothetical protein HQM13_02000 [SAR324 cluster bacterium]|nr:hypothetical protein [SAR324 cluster bacterium]